MATTLANISIKDSSSWNTLLNLIYPIGSLYFSSNSTSPGSRFGGTWVALYTSSVKDAPHLKLGPWGSGGNNTMTISQMPIHSHSSVSGNQIMTYEYPNGNLGGYGTDIRGNNSTVQKTGGATLLSKVSFCLLLVQNCLIAKLFQEVDSNGLLD